MEEFASSTVKESRTLQAEFRAARTEVVTAINEGKCPLRERAPKSKCKMQVFRLDEIDVKIVLLEVRMAVVICSVEVPMKSRGRKIIGSPIGKRSVQVNGSLVIAS